jgi:hypothetical protein
VGVSVLLLVFYQLIKNLFEVKSKRKKKRKRSVDGRFGVNSFFVTVFWEMWFKAQSFQQ